MEGRRGSLYEQLLSTQKEEHGSVNLCALRDRLMAVAREDGEETTSGGSAEEADSGLSDASAAAAPPSDSCQTNQRPAFDPQSLPHGIQSLKDLRQSAKERLLKAVVEGQLHAALLKQKQSTAIEEPSSPPTPCGPGTPADCEEMPEEDAAEPTGEAMEAPAAALRARRTLCRGLRSGGLLAALGQGKREAMRAKARSAIHSGPPAGGPAAAVAAAAPEETPCEEDLGREARAARAGLLQAALDGRVPELVEEAARRSLRRQVKETLAEAFTNGSLRALCAEAAEQPHVATLEDAGAGTKEEDAEALRQQARATLLGGARSGLLLDALKQQREARSGPLPDAGKQQREEEREEEGAHLEKSELGDPNHTPPETEADTWASQDKEDRRAAADTRLCVGDLFVDAAESNPLPAAFHDAPAQGACLQAGHAPFEAGSDEAAAGRCSAADAQRPRAVDGAAGAGDATSAPLLAHGPPAHGAAAVDAAADVSAGRGRLRPAARPATPSPESAEAAGIGRRSALRLPLGRSPARRAAAEESPVQCRPTSATPKGKREKTPTGKPSSRQGGRSERKLQLSQSAALPHSSTLMPSASEGGLPCLRQVSPEPRAGARLRASLASSAMAMDLGHAFPAPDRMATPPSPADLRGLRASASAGALRSSWSPSKRAPAYLPALSKTPATDGPIKFAFPTGAWDVGLGRRAFEVADWSAGSRTLAKWDFPRAGF